MELLYGVSLSDVNSSHSIDKLEAFSATAENTNVQYKSLRPSSLSNSTVTLRSEAELVRTSVQSTNPIVQNTNHNEPEPSRTNQVIWKWFKRCHFDMWRNVSKDLVLFRILSILGLLIYTIIDTVIYSSKNVNKSSALQFLHGSRYLALEVFIITYASGVPAFGVSIEIYILIPYVIGVCILAANNCGGPIVLTNLFWIFKVVFLLIAIEVVHRNFKKFRDYKESCQPSARAMLRQALWFSATMLFLSASGLKSLYNAVNPGSPLYCVYDTSHCGIIDLYSPQFGNNNDRCLSDLRDYVNGREQLRILRNILLLNGVSYAVYNRNMLNIEHSKKHFKIRVSLILLYVGLSTSVIVSYVDTLYFLEKCRLPYNIIELLIFTLLFVIPAFNILKIQWRERIRLSRVFAAIIDLSVSNVLSNDEVRQRENMERLPQVLF